jgi:hypothetical protein
MFDKKHLKITQKGFESYNGPLSVYEFKDGVSVEPIPRHDRDRIAATMSCIEIAENGKEVTAGVAERLVVDAADRAPKPEKLKVQSVDDKVLEEKSRAEATVGDVKNVYTEAELDTIIEDGGIAALREVANIWGAKNRSIPTLRQMVLDLQEEYVAKEGARVGKAKAAVEKIVRDTAEANDADEKIVEQEVEDDEVLAAAASGDMAAALNDEGRIDLEQRADAEAEAAREALVVEGEDGVSSLMHQIVEPADEKEA